jgi:hypothetical protein
MSEAAPAPTLFAMARLAIAALLLALVVPASARADEPPYSTADYWTFADGIMRHLDSWWDPSRDAYIFRGTPSVRVNSALLLTHSIAARNGYGGASRQDERARILVDRLTTAPAWLGAKTRGPLTTCWSRDLDRVKRQHASLESKVVEALAWAWRARAELGLSATAVRRIERRITRCARRPEWRRVRVANQINWNAEMYAAAATVSGRADLLRHEYRSQLAAFAADPAPSVAASSSTTTRPSRARRASISTRPSTPISSCTRSATMTGRGGSACARCRVRWCVACERGSRA